MKRFDSDRPVPESVSIVAMGQSSMEYVHSAMKCGNRKRVTEETWAINSMGGVLKYDLLFHMDDVKIQEMRAKEHPEWNVAGMVDWLKDAKFFTSKIYSDYPGSMPYPLKEVADSLRSMYFNSTPSYALAYAIYLEIPNIHLYGLDYSYPDKHKAEAGRACIEFMCGIAKERGLEIYIPKISTLFDAIIPKSEKPYGYDAYDVDWKVKDGEFHIEMKDKELPTALEIEKRYRNISLEEVKKLENVA